MGRREDRKITCRRQNSPRILFKDSAKNQSSEFAQFMEYGKVNKALKLLES